MKVRALMITYNRPAYTELSLARLCETVPEYAGITVWDNGSSADMIAVLKKFERHPAIERIVYNKTNERLHDPTNWFWQSVGEAEYLSKVDDDGLMPAGWCEKLIEAHSDIPQAGILGCWRFPDDDYHPELARRKIQHFGRHQIMRNCWVEGSGYLMKRSVIEKVGRLRKAESFTGLCTRAAAAGFVNGWYFPFLRQEHMDDPRAPHTDMHTEEDFRRLRPLSAHTFRITSREAWINRLKHSAWTLQACSFDPRHYTGWKAWLRRRISRWTGKLLLPRA